MANQGESSEVMTPLGEMGVRNIPVQHFHCAVSNKTFSQNCGGLSQRKASTKQLKATSSQVFGEVLQPKQVNGSN